MACLQVDVARATFLAVFLSSPGIDCCQDKYRRGPEHRLLLQSSLVECRASIVLAHESQTMMLGFVMKHAFWSEQVDLQRVERPRRGSRAKAAFIGDALSSPQELPKLGGSEWLVAVFPYRTPAAQCLFQSHIRTAYRRR
jgi:hypothetical protein